MSGWFFFVRVVWVSQRLPRARPRSLTKGGRNRWSGWDHEKIPVNDSETFICQHRGGGSNQSALRGAAWKLSRACVPVLFYEYRQVCMSCVKSVKGFLQQHHGLLNEPLYPENERSRPGMRGVQASMYLTAPEGNIPNGDQTSWSSCTTTQKQEICEVNVKFYHNFNRKIEIL